MFCMEINYSKIHSHYYGTKKITKYEKVTQEQILVNTSLQNISLRKSSAHYFATRMLIRANL